MIDKLTRALAFLLLLLSPFRAGADDRPKPKDFDGAMLVTGREGSLLLLEIPAEVYRGLRRPDMGDIRIYDAAEIPVPYTIRGRGGELFTPAPEEISFFAWNGGRENNLPSETDIEINTSGGVVRIKNQSLVPGSSREYLADLSLTKFIPSALRINMDNRGNNFNAAVSVLYSGDLSSWRSLDRRQVLASFGGTVQDTVDLSALHGLPAVRYLLLRFDGGAPSPLGMTLIFSEQEKAAEYHELIFRGNLSSDRKKVNYLLEGFFPAESIDFILAEADSIPVLVKNRGNEKDEWSVRASGTLFRYNSADGTIRNPPFELNPGRNFTQAPFWELEASGELYFSAAPELLIRWKPGELIFPARGKGPWTLAYGNAACAPLGRGELFPLAGDAELQAAVFTGEARYERTSGAPPKERDYSIYFLWAFLAAAALILTILAFSIAKSMRK
jgi:hypothetical protein